MKSDNAKDQCQQCDGPSKEGKRQLIHVREEDAQQTGGVGGGWKGRGWGGGSLRWYQYLKFLKLKYTRCAYVFGGISFLVFLKIFFIATF
jgi:hypothetical protein